VILPVGLGLFGAALQYHLHYMVLALGLFCIFFGGSAAVPTIVNYVVECFAGYGNEAAAVLNLYRIALGVTVPFFVVSWTDAVTVGWVFGMMGLFSVTVFGLIVALIWKGHEIREMRGLGLKVKSEEGTKIVDAPDKKRRHV
jgi:MFS family permease